MHPWEDKRGPGREALNSDPTHIHSHSLPGKVLLDFQRLQEEPTQKPTAPKPGEAVAPSGQWAICNCGAEQDPRTLSQAALIRTP